MKTLAKVCVSYGESIIENFSDRMKGRRGEKELRGHVRHFVRVWAKTNLVQCQTEKIAIHWDRKLGCSCGCSPGFRIKTETGSHYPAEYVAGMYDNKLDIKKYN